MATTPSSQKKRRKNTNNNNNNINNEDEVNTITTTTTTTTNTESDALGESASIVNDIDMEGNPSHSSGGGGRHKVLSHHQHSLIDHLLLHSYHLHPPLFLLHSSFHHTLSNSWFYSLSFFVLQSSSFFTLLRTPKHPFPSLPLHTHKDNTIVIVEVIIMIILF